MHPSVDLPRAHQLALLLSAIARIRSPPPPRPSHPCQLLYDDALGVWKEVQSLTGREGLVSQQGLRLTPIADGTCAVELVDLATAQTPGARGSGLGGGGSVHGSAAHAHTHAHLHRGHGGTPDTASHRSRGPGAGSSASSASSTSAAGDIDMVLTESGDHLLQVRCVCVSCASLPGPASVTACAPARRLCR
jgi:hypothetical protein